MSARGSYDALTAHQDLPSEVGRLRAQLELTWAQERGVLERHGLANAARVLDAGAGPGFLALDLVERYPQMQVTLLEPERELARVSEGDLEEVASGRYRLATGTVEASGLEARSHDFAIARLLFQHLRDPLPAATELRRLLEPGGRVALIDADAALGNLFDPELPGLQPLGRAYALQHQRAGTDAWVGRRLPRLLKAAGFRDVACEVVVAHSDVTGLAAFRHQLDPRRLGPLTTRGFLTPHQREAAERELERFQQNPAAMLLTVHFIAVGTR